MPTLHVALKAIFTQIINSLASLYAPHVDWPTNRKGQPSIENWPDRRSDLVENEV